MYAVEFQAKIKNGTIEVPDEHKDRFKGLVRVILLAEDHPAQEDLIDQLLAHPIKLEQFRPFTREETYERD